MPGNIKAIVFRTTQLKATKEFFENVLKLSIKETSARHFVLYAKGLRLVFFESTGSFEVEMYMSDTSSHTIRTCKDPNGINIVTTR